MFERDINLEREIGHQFRNVLDGEQTYQDLRSWYWQHEERLSGIERSPRYDNLLIKSTLEIFETLSDGIGDMDHLELLTRRLEGTEDAHFYLSEPNGIIIDITYKGSGYPAP